MPERKRSVELCKRDGIKLVYRINNTRYSFQKNKLHFKLLKPQFIGPILSNKSPYLNINYFSLEELGKSMILILYLEAGETEVINTWPRVVPFAIAELGQRCLQAASTLKYEPLNSCITVHSFWIMKIFNVMLLNTCSRNKRRKNRGTQREYSW